MLVCSPITEDEAQMIYRLRENPYFDKSLLRKFRLVSIRSLKLTKNISLTLKRYQAAIILNTVWEIEAMPPIIGCWLIVMTLYIHLLYIYIYIYIIYINYLSWNNETHINDFVLNYVIAWILQFYNLTLLNYNLFSLRQIPIKRLISWYT